MYIYLVLSVVRSKYQILSKWTWRVVTDYLKYEQQDLHNKCIIVSHQCMYNRVY